jgi:hypothetical protein
MRDKIAQDLIPLVQRHLALQLKGKLTKLSQQEKVGAAQILTNQAGRLLQSPFKLLVPKLLNSNIREIAGLVEFLTIEQILEMLIELLNEIEESINTST